MGNSAIISENVKFDFRSSASEGTSDAESKASIYDVLVDFDNEALEL